MKLRVAGRDYINKEEMSRRWGITRQAVNGRKKLHVDFPKPDFKVGQMEFFDIKHVQAYEKRHKIRKGGK